MSDASQLRAYLRLHLAGGVGAVLFRRLLDAFGDAESVLSASPQQWRKVEGIGEKTAAAMASVSESDVDAELAEADRHGVRVVCMADADFPAALKTLYDCPPVLYICGRLDPADAVAVSIVGARRCTHYGLEQAERFGQLLAAAGFTVVSGGARGIDTAAHRGALAADGRTIAVMGCGLCQSYPPENAELFDGVVAEGRGAVISELPMKTTPLAGHSPRGTGLFQACRWAW